MGPMVVERAGAAPPAATCSSWAPHPDLPPAGTKTGIPGIPCRANVLPRPGHPCIGWKHGGGFKLACSHGVDCERRSPGGGSC